MRPSGQIVDTPTATEFMDQILERVSLSELSTVADDLPRKSAAMRELVGDRPEAMDEATLHRLLRWSFGSRRRTKDILATVQPTALAGAIADLLNGDDDQLPARFARFDEVMAGHVEPGFDLPGELLHFLAPDRYWLWTRWMWDPRTETGALRLVTMDEVELTGPTRGDTYLAVGRAVAFVEETGKAAGFTTMGDGLFGTDVFLAAVYGVYMYTVLQMRMTQEFNKVVPPLGDLTRRLLGVYHMEG